MLQLEMYAGDPALVTQEVLGRYGVQQTEIFDGHINRVTIAKDLGVVVKVPQDGELGRLDALRTEQGALRFLEGINLNPTKIPTLLGYSPDEYLVASYVPGRVLSERDMQCMTREERERLGRSMAWFIFQLAYVDPNEVTANVPEMVEMSWSNIFDTYIRGFAHPDYPSLTRVAEEKYAEWLEYYFRGVGKKAPQCIHGDLTLANVTVKEDYCLYGVFDFARMHRGKLEEELSTVLAIDETVYWACVDELATNGMSVDHTAVVLWRELKELQVLTCMVSLGDPSEPTPLQLKLRDKIATRYPHLNWAELYKYVLISAR